MLRRNEIGTMPLPPTGLPTFATWRIAYVRAPSPVPGVCGETPHTVGPIASAGPINSSDLK
ncbi:unannotated protein [freshwater metagenome]|uniref:Unannotated protein n=1 Tax=freshwater metagenome TaxID=449393 RepID=A0A6J6UJU8_9ZZZZ